jgi:hypothetical protein
VLLLLIPSFDCLHILPRLYSGCSFHCFCLERNFPMAAESATVLMIVVLSSIVSKVVLYRFLLLKE